MANIPHEDLSESYKNQPGQKYSLGDSIFILKEGYSWDGQVGYIIDINIQNSRVVVQKEKNSDMNISKEAFYYYEVMAADPLCVAIKFLYRKTHALLVYIHHGF